MRALKLILLIIILLFAAAWAHAAEEKVHPVSLAEESKNAFLP